MRRFKGKLFVGLSYISALIVVLSLFGIIGTIGYNAIPYMTLDFLLTPESEVPGFGGGIANAIAGTILLAIFSPAIAAPMAIGTAIYLKKYARDSFLVRSVSFLLDVLSGTPSIVLGMFGLVFLALYMRYFTGGMSLLSATIALAILVLPVIERATENALDSVPAELEEASYAMGATKWETITKITVPCALSGILTGILLSTGRAAEESAVVILTASYSQFFPDLRVLPNKDLIFGLEIYPFQERIGALPITVYHGFEFPHLVSPSESYAASFTLILIVMLINLGTRLLLRRRKIG